MDGSRKREWSNGVLFVGPIPPPTYGQSVATKNLRERLATSGVVAATINLSEFDGVYGKIRAHLKAATEILRGARGPVYVSVNANAGQWLTVVLAALCRIGRKPLYLHHHAYGYIRRRRASMGALSWVAGDEAVHLVLGRKMASELRAVYHGVENVHVINNAGLIDPELSKSSERAERNVTFGHMSNLSEAKGTLEFCRAATEARRCGLDASFICAGPFADSCSKSAVAAAVADCGGAFNYLGPVDSAQKRVFFQAIDFFVFPSRYKNEASPLVLLEAMAAGVPCVARDVGCVADDIGGAGHIYRDEQELVGVIKKLASIERAQILTMAREARRRYRQLRQEHEDQVQKLIDMLRSKSTEWQ
ncbi:glycosyltransferase family 4 protein [Xanthobacteraceae bacterium Astr-EGSB]|uniref:glycosyltransferase family 4 protein n=1 Tax=Astrobacterium formosum TaxID=3069710 RepID=UPI0027B3A9DD|nr:glycosyltransferase family 4 protein [Xanthobacteraceae bacterium Astr-EGSB]